MMKASIPIPGFEKSSRSARSFASCTESECFFLSSEEGFAVMELELRTTIRGSFGDLVKNEGLVLNLVKMGTEAEKK